jgi:hypothetical protein
MQPNNFSSDGIKELTKLWNWFFEVQGHYVGK